MDPSQLLETIYSPTEVIINLILSFFLGLFISYVYKNTHKGMSYSQSFMITNIFVAIIVCMVIMIIGNSIARAFALVGALSIIRFRTAIKEPEELVYLFFVIAIGLANGANQFLLSIISTLIMFLYLFFINYESNLFEKIRISSFNVISILSGTGYVTDDFGLWGKFSLIFFLLLMFIGGCAGSTTCGIKVFRVHMLYFFLKNQLLKIIYIGSRILY